MLRSASTCVLLLTATLAPAVAAARPAGNAFHVGRDIVVPAGQSVHHAVCVLCSIQLEGAAQGSLIAIAGNIYLDGPARASVIALGSHVTLTGKATVVGHLVVFGGRLFKAPAATTGRGVLVIAPIVFLPIILFIASVIAALVFLLRYLLIREPAAFPPLPRL